MLFCAFNCTTHTGNVSSRFVNLSTFPKTKLKTSNCNNSHSIQPMPICKFFSLSSFLLPIYTPFALSSCIFLIFLYLFFILYLRISRSTAAHGTTSCVLYLHATRTNSVTYTVLDVMTRV